MQRTVTNTINKNSDDAFQFLTSAFASFAVMDRSQFETLVGELEQLRDAPTSPRRAAHFPPFKGAFGSLRICIVKESADEYRLIANYVGDCLCIMTGDEFALLLWKLKRLMAGDPNQDPVVYFPSFTYPITG